MCVSFSHFASKATVAEPDRGGWQSCKTEKEFFFLNEGAQS